MQGGTNDWQCLTQKDQFFEQSFFPPLSPKLTTWMKVFLKIIIIKTRKMKNNSYRLKVGWAATDYPINMHSCVRSRADQPLKAVLSLTRFCYEECSCLSFLAIRCHCDTLPRLSRWLSQSSALTYATLVLWVPWFSQSFLTWHWAIDSLHWLGFTLWYQASPALQETLSCNTQGSHTLLNPKAWETHPKAKSHILHQEWF